MKVDIRIETGSSGVTVSIGQGGADSPAATLDGAAGAGGAERPGTGGGPSEIDAAGKVVIIGPIVINGTRPGSDSADTGSGGAERPGTSSRDDQDSQEGSGGAERPGTGGGPSTSGSGSTVVIIGPVVVQASGEVSTTPMPVTKSRKSHNKPPSDGKFVGVKQQKDKWCWAAVSLGIERHFAPTSTLTQCKVAQKVFANKFPPANVSCCANPDDCNKPEKLEDALAAVDRRKEIQIGPLDFESLKKEIDHGLPVCARIGWRAGGGHFVVIRGCRIAPSGTQQVSIADPFFADSTMSYEQFKTGYGSATQPGGGQWTHTYFVKA